MLSYASPYPATWYHCVYDKDTLSTIRLLKGALQLEEINKKSELTDDEIIGIVSKQIKTRKESIAEFEKAGRDDLAIKTKNEITILEKYLPEQLTEDEIEKLVVEAISESGATSPKDMGRVMSILRPKTAGKAAGKLVSDIVKEKLANM